MNPMEGAHTFPGESRFYRKEGVAFTSLKSFLEGLGKQIVIEMAALASLSNVLVQSSHQSAMCGHITQALLQLDFLLVATALGKGFEFQPSN
jgi:hypothetical protein